MEVLNFNLMKQPLNWLTIWLMLFIAGIALHLIMKGLGISVPLPAPAGYAPAQAPGTSPA